MGKAYATFLCNAAVAVLGVGILLFSHFPPVGARVMDGDVEEEESERLVAEDI